jgi:hypothetical protein
MGMEQFEQALCLNLFMLLRTGALAGPQVDPNVVVARVHNVHGHAAI